MTHSNYLVLEENELVCCLSSCELVLMSRDYVALLPGRFYFLFIIFLFCFCFLCSFDKIFFVSESSIWGFFYILFELNFISQRSLFFPSSLSPTKPPVVLPFMFRISEQKEKYSEFKKEFRFTRQIKNDWVSFLQVLVICHPKIVIHSLYLDGGYLELGETGEFAHFWFERFSSYNSFYSVTSSSFSSFSSFSSASSSFVVPNTNSTSSSFTAPSPSSSQSKEKNILHLSVWSKGEFGLMDLLSNMVDSLKRSFPSVGYDVFVPCQNCVRSFGDSGNGHCFSMSQIVMALQSPPPSSPSSSSFSFSSSLVTKFYPSTPAANSNSSSPSSMTNSPFSAFSTSPSSPNHVFSSSPSTLSSTPTSPSPSPYASPFPSPFPSPTSSSPSHHFFPSSLPPPSSSPPSPRPFPPSPSSPPPPSSSLLSVSSSCFGVKCGGEEVFVEEIAPYLIFKGWKTFHPSEVKDRELLGFLFSFFLFDFLFFFSLFLFSFFSFVFYLMKEERKNYSITKNKCSGEGGHAKVYSATIEELGVVAIKELIQPQLDRKTTFRLCFFLKRERRERERGGEEREEKKREKKRKKKKRKVDFSFHFFLGVVFFF